MSTLSGSRLPIRTRTSLDSRLPVRHDLRLVYAASLLIALLVAGVSIAGIVYGTTLYPPEQRIEQTSNDVLNLVVVLPLLLGSMWFARRGRLIGLLCWPGALLYVLYIYVAYVFGVPLNALFLVYVGLIPLTAYTLIGLLSGIDGQRTYEQSARMPSRTVGGVLILLALFFGGYQVAEIVSAAANRTSMEPLLLALAVSDLTVQAPALLLGGILLLRRHSLGYVAGPGLLLQIGALLVGAVVTLGAQGVTTGEPIIEDALVMFGLSLVPLGLLVVTARTIQA